ncbi:MAG TPA: TetR/AcrR family transcriptional regulator [Solirubrobacterales bacterium]|nr:TetR/AcrR family transcriptional regulator [Solirubrobacterales bacterium]
MTTTPWGDSERLREERLPPGPSNTPEAVAENQRRRLYGAMVASVAERGYESTRVADLVEISGVSLRSFYDLFDDKAACLAGAVGTLVKATIGATLTGESDGDWEQDSRDRLKKFAALLSEHSAAARMCLVEAYVAGGEAEALVEQSIVRVEGLVRERLAVSKRYSDLPPEMATIAVAAIIEIFRSRLLSDQAEALPEVADELSGLLLSYEPPARPLRSAARAPETRPERLEASDHAERGLRAFEALLTRQSFNETTMEQVAQEAKMSVRTLYANFAGREELMQAAVDGASAQVVATVMPAFRRHPHPAEGVRAALATLLMLLASRPNLTHLLLLGAREGGAPALRRRSAGLAPLRPLLTAGLPAHRLPINLRLGSEALLDAVIGLATRRLTDAGAAALPGLAPICTFVALSPVLGIEGATAAAEGKSYRRPSPQAANALMQVGTGPANTRLTVALSLGPKTVDELATETLFPPAEVEAQLAELERQGFAEPLDPEDSPDRHYRSTWSWIGSKEWSKRGKAEREQTSAEILEVIQAEIEEAFEKGTFDSRVERSLIRIGLWLDESGWRELSGVIDASLEECLEIQRRATRRLKEAGDSASGSEARVAFISFEVPPSD